MNVFQLIIRSAVLFGLLYFLFRLIKSWWKLRKFPGPIPFLGKHSIDQYLLRNRTLVNLKYYREINRIYGRIVVTWVFGSPRILIYDAALIKRVFSDTETFKKGLDYKRIIGTVFGDGLVTSDGEMWKQQRKILNTFFNITKLYGHLPNISKQTVELMNKHMEKNSTDPHQLPQPAGKEEGVLLDVQHFFHLLLLYIFGRMAFNWDLEKRPEEAEDFLALTLKGSVIGGIRIALGIPVERYPILPGTRFILDMAIRIRTTFTKKIEERIEVLNKLSKEELESRPKDITTILLENEVPRKVMIDQMITLLAAGHETTANFCSFTIHALAQYPDIQRKVKNEVDSVLQGREEITKEDIQKMTYLNSVLLEVLRFYNVIPFVSRVAMADFNLAEFGWPELTIPKDTGIIIPICVLHRDSDYWENQAEFQPERFLNNKKGFSSDCFTPFITGPRHCIGQSLAIMESCAVVALVCQRYRFKIREGHKLNLFSAISMRSTTGIEVHAIPWGKTEVTDTA